MIYYICLCNSRVCLRVWVTRRVQITRRVRVWKYFPTRVRVRVTRRIKFTPCGCGYGWPLPVGFVPVAILRHDAPQAVTFFFSRTRHSYSVRIFVPFCSSPTPTVVSIWSRHVSMPQWRRCMTGKALARRRSYLSHQRPRPVHVHIPPLKRCPEPGQSRKSQEAMQTA